MRIPERKPAVAELFAGETEPGHELPDRIRECGRLQSESREDASPRPAARLDVAAEQQPSVHPEAEKDEEGQRPQGAGSPHPTSRYGYFTSSYAESALALKRSL